MEGLNEKSKEELIAMVLERENTLVKVLLRLDAIDKRLDEVSATNKQMNDLLNNLRNIFKSDTYLQVKKSYEKSVS